MAAGFAAVALHPVSALAQAVPQTTIQVPRNVFVRDVAVSATQKVVIGNGATVGGATPTTPVVIANTGSVLTQLGLGTHVNANIFSVAPVW
ncbi:MAG TPA: hypothetical protein VH044_12265, partial [Polyangiaceae bacterium]|nr:hypothetical protein [Polyangiaceae bacterium]